MLSIASVEMTRVFGGVEESERRQEQKQIPFGNDNKEGNCKGGYT